jgi:arabinogalactan oligomer/maltooligosaccharide transport system substrate-binding protein
MYRIHKIFSLFLIVLLAACGGEAATPAPTSNSTVGEPQITALAASPTTEPQTEESGTAPETVRAQAAHLVLWHSWTGADGDALAAILDDFQKENPTVTIDTLFVTYDELPQSYADAVLAGGGPDLILTANWWLNDMVKAQTVQPLDELLNASDLDSYWPATVDVLRRQGKLYGLPTYFELVSLFYNRALLAGAALPKTTDELTALAKANPSQGIGLYASLYHVYWGFPAYGAQFMDANGKILLDRGQGAGNFLAWLNDLRTTPGSFVDSDYGMVLDRFKKEEFAFFVDGPWSIRDLSSALGENLAITTLPSGPASAAQPWLSADGVFLNPNLAAGQQQAALHLALFLTNTQSGSTLAKVAKRLPAARQALLGDDPILTGFMTQAATGQAIETRTEMDAVWGYGGDMIAKVLGGVNEPGEAVRQTTALINDVNGKD